jgi:hypothetical protein
VVHEQTAVGLLESLERSQWPAVEWKRKHTGTTDNIGCFTHGWHIEWGKNNLDDITDLSLGSPSWPWLTPNIGKGMFDTLWM